jgi:hypothetical protein
MVASSPAQHGETRRVVRVEFDARLRTDGHEHVRLVETEEASGARRWTGVDVIAAIRYGDRFVLTPEAGASGAVLEPTICPRCPMATLEISAAEAARS